MKQKHYTLIELIVYLSVLGIVIFSVAGWVLREVLVFAGVW